MNTTLLALLGLLCWTLVLLVLLVLLVRMAAVRSKPASCWPHPLPVRLRQVSSGILSAMVLAASSAAACSCRTGNLPERIAVAQIVIVGTVTGFAPLQSVTLRPIEVFKGHPGALLKIPTGTSDCDFFLPPVIPRVGDEYLVYLGQLEGRLFASRCQNSGLVAHREAELAELRKRARPKT